MTAPMPGPDPAPPSPTCPSDTKGASDFLLASLADMQATIRALDFKAYFLLLVISIPLAKVELLRRPIIAVAERSVPLIVLLGFTFLVWVVAIGYTFSTLTARINPVKDVKPCAPPPPTGLFFSPALWAASRNARPDVSAAERLDESRDRESRALALAEEQLKVGCILHRKLDRMVWAARLTQIWCALAIALWCAWIYLQWSLGDRG
jgi:hypothetical protein